MRRAAAGFAVLVPAGWFLLLGAVYWLTWVATVRRTVRALRAPAPASAPGAPIATGARRVP